MKIKNLVLSKTEGLKFKINPSIINTLFEQPLNRVEKFTFYLLIFSIPIQIGKHFWPHFSYVNGVRIDYLSPTLYFTDILTFVLFCLCLFTAARKRSKIYFKNSPSVIARRNDEAISFIMGLPRSLSVARNDIFKHAFKLTNKAPEITIRKFIIPNSFFIILFIILILSSIFSKQPLASFYGLLKILEFIFLGFYISKKINRQNISTFISLLSISALIFSLIGIAQFFKQQSIGGLLYYLGERTFNSSTIGIANMNINGSLILRPYSTFAHPNIFAFYLFFAEVLIISQIKFIENKFAKMLLLLSLAVSGIALFLTFSRIIIFIYIIFLLYVTFKHNLKKIILFLLPLIFILLFIYLYNFSYRFFDINFLLKDLFLRQDLVNISLQIFKDHPLFGIGLKNFFYFEAEFQKTITPTLFQPVHNIYILTLVETGIIGLIFFCSFLLKSFSVLLKKIKETKKPEIKNFYNLILFIFISILTVGLFDHFFLTLQQGQLLFAIILGLSWTRIK